MVPARPCRRESPANRYGIELNHANGVARELGRAPIARLCTPDDYSDHSYNEPPMTVTKIDNPVRRRLVATVVDRDNGGLRLHGRR